MPGIRKSDPAYRRATLAMLAVGLATFNGLYCTQALLPTFTSVFNVTPTTASLTISAATGTMALMIVPASVLSERFGRGRMLILSLLLATGFGLAIPFLNSMTWIIVFRGLQGACFAGAPAVAMTWLSEEIDKRDLAGAMGLYIAGNSLGGLSGRLIPAGIMELASWRWAMGLNAMFALIMALSVWVLLPAQQNFRPRRIELRTELQVMLGHWMNRRLAALFLIAMLALGTSVSIYNYIGFRMIELFGLSEGLVGLLFLMYLSGTWSSARAGNFVRRWGQGPTIVGCATLMLVTIPLFVATNLTLILLGLFVFTAAFFALHSVASGWVGLTATSHRAETSSMYLFCYYVGSSLFGWLSGYFFHHSWTALLIWLADLAALIVMLSAWLWRGTPQPN
ncbi:MFS transporter [Corynebacterium epidermidicanis]|uniref:Arabinose efflux permease family protein n=1 Tax=Corynebacterium epidermidicanis TaxID=1050174 RepID=A0A0G3GLL6_9CORY|nr:MFS transporter [Corynebacterium epidermidicanis]AKK02064.1 arabinose efflux permease family protein [Corynebacterium epidermidicanis]